ncbi:hypothetical protein LLEC1_07256 [Akanthomyces lecanii]|uniref:Palmitoyltransferase n=1 Tax=Cordyceps confragosa TaxID=2714763 RepID=A0A179IIW2_CORDF|nr:hypothetical protein LLEC1_07256 [Akanthomyces lecanii]
MASRPSSGRPTSPHDGTSFLASQDVTAQHARPASIMSSRMTDVGSDDGRPSVKESKNGPGRTGATGASRSKSPPITRQQNQSGKTGPTAPAPTTNRSHIPSLTSNAFFRPMSSQKLQAQRAASARPAVTLQPPAELENLDDGMTDAGASTIGNSAIHRKTPSDVRPHSRGTEVADQETLDRLTANASPTTGHFPTDSLTDSMRPLKQRQNSTHEQPNSPVAEKSSRSFRSSFRLGRRSDADAGRHRDTNGAEKLHSNASSPRLRPVDSQGRPVTSATTKTRRDHGKLGWVYQYFEGNTVFCLGGRWQNTRHRPMNIATGIFVLVPCILFFVSEASWLWHNVSPALPIVCAYLSFICFSSFVHASVSDPGILPRNLHQFPPLGDNDDPLQLGPPTNDWTLVKSAEPSAAAMEVPVKYCRTCNIWRPPRAHHCRLCDNCIETHDHHCVWLNNCVGKRNYKYFFAFITSGTLLSLFLIGTSLAQILIYRSRRGISFSQAIDHFRAPFALVIIAALGFCYPFALLVYHLFWIARGETTREYVNSHKFDKKERYRPFSQGNLFKNFIAVLCRPRGPSYYTFKGNYQHGDQRLGLRRDLRSRQNSQGMELGAVPGATQGFQGPVALRGESRQ